MSEINPPRCPEGMSYVPEGSVLTKLDDNQQPIYKTAPAVCLDREEASLEVALQALQKYREYREKYDYDKKFEGARRSVSYGLYPNTRLLAPAIVDKLEVASDACKALGKRLPTTLEWLRGAAFTFVIPDNSLPVLPDGHFIPFGNVREQPANAIGLKGMETNALEWTDGYSKVGEKNEVGDPPVPGEPDSWAGTTEYSYICGRIEEVFLKGSSLSYIFDAFLTYINMPGVAGFRCATEPTKE